MEDRDEHVARRAYHTHGVAWAYQPWSFAFFVVEARSVEMTLDIEGKPFAGNESNVFDLDSDWPAYFCIGDGTTTATDSCSMAWGIPWVLCKARRMLASTEPGGVDGDADDAGLVDVEYDCSGGSGMSGLAGGLGYAVLASTGMGVGFGDDIDGYLGYGLWPFRGP